MSNMDSSLYSESWDSSSNTEEVNSGESQSKDKYSESESKSKKDEESKSIKSINFRILIKDVVYSFFYIYLKPDFAVFLLWIHIDTLIILHLNK